MKVDITIPASKEYSVAQLSDILNKTISSSTNFFSAKHKQILFGGCANKQEHSKLIGLLLLFASLPSFDFYVGLYGANSYLGDLSALDVSRLCQIFENRNINQIPISLTAV